MRSPKVSAKIFSNIAVIYCGENLNKFFYFFRTNKAKQLEINKEKN